MLGFRFYSVFMCVCFFPECFMSFFSFLCVYVFLWCPALVAYSINNNNNQYRPTQQPVAVQSTCFLGVSRNTNSPKWLSAQVWPWFQQWLPVPCQPLCCWSPHIFIYSSLNVRLSCTWQNCRVWGAYYMHKLKFDQRLAVKCIPAYYT